MNTTVESFSKLLVIWAFSIPSSNSNKLKVCFVCYSCESFHTNPDIWVVNKELNTSTAKKLFIYTSCYYRNNWYTSYRRFH